MNNLRLVIDHTPEEIEAHRAQVQAAADLRNYEHYKQMAEEISRAEFRKSFFFGVLVAIVLLGIIL